LKPGRHDFAEPVRTPSSILHHTRTASVDVQEAVAVIVLPVTDLRVARKVVCSGRYALIAVIVREAHWIAIGAAGGDPIPVLIKPLIHAIDAIVVDAIARLCLPRKDRSAARQCVVTVSVVVDRIGGGKAIQDGNSTRVTEPIAVDVSIPTLLRQAFINAAVAVVVLSITEFGIARKILSAAQWVIVAVTIAGRDTVPIQVTRVEAWIEIVAINVVPIAVFIKVHRRR